VLLLVGLVVGRGGIVVVGCTIHQSALDMILRLCEAYGTLIWVFSRISDMVGGQLYRPFVEGCEEALREGDYIDMSTCLPASELL
jgi:hypothetical protein